LTLFVQTQEFLAISKLTPKHIHKRNPCPSVFIRLPTFATMNGSMSLGEQCEAHMKSYQTIATCNQELQQRLDESEGQNTYVPKQLGESMKLKQQLFQSAFRSVQGEGSEVEGQLRELSSEEEPLCVLGENEDVLFPTSMT